MAARTGTSSRNGDLRLGAISRGFMEWLVGFGFLSLHIGAYLVVGTGLFLVNLYRTPDDVTIQGSLRRWGIVVLVHAVAACLLWAARSATGVSDRSRERAAAESSDESVIARELAFAESELMPRNRFRPAISTPADATAERATSLWRPVSILRKSSGGEHQAHETGHAAAAASTVAPSWSAHLSQAKRTVDSAWTKTAGLTTSLASRAKVAAATSLDRQRTTPASEQPAIPIEAPQVDPEALWYSANEWDAAGAHSWPERPHDPGEERSEQRSPHETYPGHEATTLWAPRPVPEPVPAPETPHIDPLKAMAGAGDALAGDSATLPADAQWSWVEAAAAAWLAQREADGDEAEAEAERAQAPSSANGHHPQPE